MAAIFDRLRRRYDKHKAYAALFNDPHAPGQLSQIGSEVLADLRAFCAGSRTTMVLDSAGAVDPYGTVMAEGRRQVWLHLMGRLNLSEDMMARLREAEMTRERQGDQFDA